MKKLICYADIQEVYEQGETYLIINEDTIVTPLARDLIDEYHIEVKRESQPTNSKIEEDLGMCLSKESLIKLLRKVLTEGGQSQAPFEAVTHSNGLKVINGDTVRLSTFDTGKPGDKVYYQELVSVQEATVAAGILEIKETSFDWTLDKGEINYVISGQVIISIDGIDYIANAGDTIYIPSQSTITWRAKDQAKLFCVTCPTN